VGILNGVKEENNRFKSVLIKLEERLLDINLKLNAWRRSDDDGDEVMQ
jgi:hypothetical protein